MEKLVELDVNGCKLKFNVTSERHEQLINEMQPNKKVAPMHNFLMRCIDPACKDDLKRFAENPASTAEICGFVLEQFTPTLKITLGE